MSTNDPETANAVNGGLHQSVARVDLVLTALAASPEHGLRLLDVCRATGLGKTTAHRLLTGLVAYRLADFDELSNRYFVGFKIFAWACGAGNRFGLSRMAAPALRRLADTFGDVIYLLVRNGGEGVCVDRVEGSFPIKTLALGVGVARPLGIGAGSLSMLAALGPAEAEAVLRAGAAARAGFGIGDDDLAAMLAETRRQGFSFIDGKVVAGIATIGVALRLDDGSPIAAISLSTTQDRLRPPRRAEIAAAIRHEVDGLTREFRPFLTAHNARDLVRSAIG